MYISSDIPLNTPREVPGKAIDMALLEESQWLMNTEVKYFIQERKSRWHLSMLYISADNPLKFICRKIDTYNSEMKAITFARILQRGIRKDARGIIKSNTDAFNICPN